MSQEADRLPPSRVGTNPAIDGLLAFETAFRHGATGGLDEARRAYTMATESGDSIIAAQANLQLAILLFHHGALDDAKQSFERALESGDIDAAPRAQNGIGAVHAVQGDVEGARAAYRLAIDSGHHDAGPKAARNLGLLLEQDHRDLAGAARAFKDALESGHVEQAPLAANSLGALLEDSGDIAGAREAYLRAALGRDPTTAAKGARNLGQLLDKEGESEGSKGAFRYAAALERPGEIVDLAPLDESLALAGTDGDDSNAVLDRFLESAVLALGKPAGDLSIPGQGTESDLLHFTVDDPSGGPGDRVILPVFTQPALLRQALLRNPDWQTLSVLQVLGRALYENVEEDVTIVLNPWSRLEFQLQTRAGSKEIDNS